MAYFSGAHNFNIQGVNFGTIRGNLVYRNEALTVDSYNVTSSAITDSYNRTTHTYQQDDSVTSLSTLQDTSYNAETRLVASDSDSDPTTEVVVVTGVQEKDARRAGDKGPLGRRMGVEESDGPRTDDKTDGSTTSLRSRSDPPTGEAASKKAGTWSKEFDSTTSPKSGLLRRKAIRLKKNVRRLLGSVL